VTERRFHKAIYPTSAVDGAVAAFARFAALTVRDEGEHRVVAVATAKPERALRVARELANYALGLVREAEK
jgi:hypothetical protein